MINLLNFPHNLEDMMLEEENGKLPTPDEQPNLNSKNTINKNGEKNNEVITNPNIAEDEQENKRVVKSSNLIPWI